MNPDLFLAILSMDVYNRPGSQTVGLALPDAANSGLGDATLTNTVDLPDDNYFAGVYYLNDTGQTVIAYRGTDSITDVRLAGR